MIKLEPLRVFVAVANSGNIAGAADMLGRTPSAISMALSALEREIGAPLFETDRKNQLTPLGRFAYDTAQAQIRGFDAAIAAIHAFADNRIGRLSIASVPSVATHILPEALSNCLDDRPGLELDLTDTDSWSVAQLVDSGIAELGLAGAPAKKARLEFRPLFRDRFRLVCAAASPLAIVGKALTWRDLVDATFIRNAASDTVEFPELRAQYFRSGLVVRNVASLLAMVRLGRGVTLLPALATLDLPEGLAVRDIDIRGAVRVVGALTRNATRPSPALAGFLEVLDASLQARATALGIELVAQ